MEWVVEPGLRILLWPQVVGLILRILDVSAQMLWGII